MGHGLGAAGRADIAARLDTVAGAMELVILYTLFHLFIFFINMAPKSGLEM